MYTRALLLFVGLLCLEGCVWNKVEVEHQTVYDISQQSSPALKVRVNDKRVDVDPQWTEGCRITHTRKETVEMTMLALTFSEGFWPMVFPVDVVLFVVTTPYTLIERPFLSDSFKKKVKVIGKEEKEEATKNVSHKVLALSFPDGRKIEFAPFKVNRDYVATWTWCKKTLDPLLTGSVPRLSLTAKRGEQTYLFESGMDGPALAELTMKAMFSEYYSHKSIIDSWVEKILKAPKKGPLVAHLQKTIRERQARAWQRVQAQAKSRAEAHARWKEERRLRVENMPRLKSRNAAAAAAIASVPMEYLYEGVNSRIIKERAFNLHFAEIDGVKLLVLPISCLPRGSLVFERGSWKFPGYRWDSRKTELPAVTTRAICAKIRPCATCGGGGSVASGRYRIQTTYGTTRKDVTYRDSSGRKRTEFGALVDTSRTTATETQTGCKVCKGTGIRGY